jgi:hypothetical protein
VNGCASGYTKVAMKKYASDSLLNSDIATARSNTTSVYDVKSVKTIGTDGGSYATVCKIQKGCNVNNRYCDVYTSWLKYYVK